MTEDTDGKYSYSKTNKTFSLSVAWGKRVVTDAQWRCGIIRILKNPSDFHAVNKKTF